MNRFGMAGPRRKVTGSNTRSTGSDMEPSVTRHEPLCQESVARKPAVMTNPEQVSDLGVATVDPLSVTG